MNSEQLKPILEAALLAAGEPVTLERLRDLFSETEEEKFPVATLKDALTELANDYADRGIELKELASGYCFQAKAEFSPWLRRLWQERPTRYSRAFLETLAVIAYRQPVTRGEIEDIRGVAVSSNIIKTLLEREWVKMVGQREVPGRPSLYATTKQFLDHFNLKSLEELPILIESQDLELAANQLEAQILDENASMQLLEVDAEVATAEVEETKLEIVSEELSAGTETQLEIVAVIEDNPVEAIFPASTDELEIIEEEEAELAVANQ